MPDRATEGGNISYVQEEARRLRRNVRQQTLSYIVAAFGLIAGLAWNDAISALIAHLFPATSDELVAKFVYAGFITIVVVLITVPLARLLKTDDRPRSS